VVDKSTDEAIEQAKIIAAKGDTFSEAVVDRFDGLVVVGREASWHFVSPICGYSGSGPMATATILELFGFGKKAKIFEEINTGDNHASYTFTK
jgi:hypothetical protein